MKAKFLLLVVVILFAGGAAADTVVYELNNPRDLSDGNDYSEEHFTTGTTAEYTIDSSSTGSWSGCVEGDGDPCIRIARGIETGSGNTLNQWTYHEPDWDGGSFWLNWMSHTVTLSSGTDIVAYADQREVAPTFSHQFDQLEITMKIEAPDKPSNPSPYDGKSSVSRNPRLSVKVTHPNGYSMDLTFKDSSGNVLGTVSNVASGSRASVSTADDSFGSSYGSSYSWYVEADDGQATTTSNTWSFSTVSEPNPPDNPSPGNGADDVSPTRSLSVDVSHPDGNSMDVKFYLDDGSGYSYIGQDSNVPNGGTATVNPSDFDMGKTYSWYAVARANGANTRSNTWQFSTNHVPSVSNLRPSGQGVDANPTLKADVQDEDGDCMTVTFRDSSDGSVIGTDSNICGSGTATFDTSTVEFGSSYGTGYGYRAVVDDGSSSERSGVQTFITNSRPRVESHEVNEKASGHAISFNATVRDLDGREQISSCELQVTGSDGGTETYSITPRPLSSLEAYCPVQRIDFRDGGWSHLEDLDLRFEVADESGASSSMTAEASLPNHKPGLDRIEVQNYPNRNAFGVSAEIDYRDNGTYEVRSCTVVIDDGSREYSVGSLEKVGSTARCVQENIGPGEFPGITLDEELTITVRATDIHGSTVQRQTLYNVPTELQYDYSAAVLQAGAVEYVDYRVVNQAGIESRYRTQLNGVNASFTPSGNRTIEYSLDPGETRTFSVEVIPEVNETARKQLRITTENLDTGLEKTHEIPVGVVNVGTPPAQPVPGPGLLQLLALISAATYLYWRTVN